MKRAICKEASSSARALCILHAIALVLASVALFAAIVALVLAVISLVACTGDVKVHGMPDEIRLNLGCGTPDAGHD